MSIFSQIRRLQYSSLCVLMLLLSCNSPQKAPDTDKDKGDSSKHISKLPRTATTDGVNLRLIVTAKLALLRAEPDPAAAELYRCKETEELQYLNELSTFTTPMRIQGIDYDEPWLKAKTADGKVGWIYAGNVLFNGLSDAKLAEMVFDRRLYKVLGDELTKKLKVYQKEMRDVKTLSAFRMLFHRSESLRKEIDAMVNEKLALASKDALPDFFWLNEAFPGFLVHLLKNKTEYRLFRDFRHWARLAAQTEEPADDTLIHTYLIAYQSDSIEFLHQDWRLALSEEETYSLLGRGIHKAVLDGVEAALKQSEDFEPELSELKQQLLDDISLSTDYWEEKSLILKELDVILKTKYKILNKADKIELTTRRKMLADPAKYKLRTNLYQGG